MSEETVFNVVFQGKLIPGVERDVAVANFAKAFKLPLAKAKKLFDGQRRVIKKNLGREKATLFRQQLKKLGVRVVLVKVEQAASAKEGRFTLSPPGVVLAPQVYRPPVHIDTSGLSVSEITGPLVEKPAVAPPRFALDELTVEDSYEALEESQPAPALELDLSGLQVDEPGVVIVASKPPPAPEFDISGLSLDEKGALLVTAEKKVPPDIPTDHIQLQDPENSH